MQMYFEVHLTTNISPAVLIQVLLLLQNLLQELYTAQLQNT